MHRPSGCKYRPNGNAHSVFSLKPTAAVPCGPCCDFTSSDDDEHNTDKHFLLLFADVDITPTLLEGLTEVDVLHIALGCRFRSGYFSRFRCNFPQHLIMSHFLTILSSPLFEHGWYTCLLTDALASSLGHRSWKGTHILSFTLYGRNSWLHSVNSRRVDFHRSCTARL